MQSNQHKFLTGLSALVLRRYLVQDSHDCANAGFAEDDKRLLHTACEDHLRLLHAVDCFPGNGGLYAGPAARNAVERFGHTAHTLVQVTVKAGMQNADLQHPNIDICCNTTDSAHTSVQVPVSMDSLFSNSTAGAMRYQQTCPPCGHRLGMARK